MQKIATQVFIVSSLLFGVIGILLVLTVPEGGGGMSDFGARLVKLLQISVFIILPSFALSVAGKYLNGKS
jgi:hypothetical protein